MNMFRHIFTVAFLALGIALWVVKLDDWAWVHILGPDAISVIVILLNFQPFSTLVCVVVAVALFMTRKQF